MRSTTVNTNSASSLSNILLNLKPAERKAVRSLRKAWPGFNNDEAAIKSAILQMSFILEENRERVSRGREGDTLANGGT